MHEPAISISGLRVSFSGRTVLDDISTEVSKGRITMLIGPSGSGKTTLLRAINRLNEEFSGCSVSGDIRVALGGRKLDAYRDLSMNDLRRKVGMVFQVPNVFPYSIRKNLLAPLKLINNMSSGERYARMKQVLYEVELWDEVYDRLNDNALTLSGGQQQRLCLARTLALSPEILLLDEPTSSLDVRSAGKIEQLLVKLKQRYTILAVSHSIRQVRQIADRVIVLNNGRIVKSLERCDLDKPGLIEELVEDVF